MSSSKERFYVDIMSAHPEVTGSCNLVIVKYPDGITTRFIVDCGLFQEREYGEYNQNFPFKEEHIEFAILTHNHVDHLGRFPLLVKNGFTGKIHTTKATALFAPLALYDSYKVLRDMSKRNTRKELYTENDVSDACSRLVGHEFNETVQLNDSIKVTFLKNGHLIGSALVLVQISCHEHPDINLLFTGDYNKENIFFDVPDLPDWILDMPITIVQESTYGDMDSAGIVKCFEKNILSALEKKGTIIATVFSLGRAQEILYMLKHMQDEGKLSVDIPIFFDGKLAHKYTRLYMSKYKEIGIREEMKEFLPENLIWVDRTNRAEALDNPYFSKIIVTTSGMGTYGPAQLYIPRYISEKNCLIQFTGYCAEGTLGDRLKSAKMGDVVSISSIIKEKKADVQYSTEFSAHAKANELIDFLKQFKHLKLVLVNHGETETKRKFAERIVREVNSKMVAILNREYLFRVCPYGLVKAMSTKFDI